MILYLYTIIKGRFPAFSCLGHGVSFFSKCDDTDVHKTSFDSWNGTLQKIFSPRFFDLPIFSTSWSRCSKLPEEASAVFCTVSVDLDGPGRLLSAPLSGWVKLKSKDLLDFSDSVF